MPLRVASFCSYLTRVEEDHPWTDADHSASKFVKAIKQKPFKGWATIPLRRVMLRLDSSNADRAADWFAVWAADRLPKNRRIGLIPIPSSSTTPTSTVMSRAADLARRIVKHCTLWKVDDVLRFRTVLDKASEGGPRWADELYPQLIMLKWTPTLTEYYLVDDVCTSGGHARACMAVLKKRAGIVPLGLLCAGRTVHEPPPDPFSVPDEDLEDTGFFF